MSNNLQDAIIAIEDEVKRTLLKFQQRVASDQTQEVVFILKDGKVTHAELRYRRFGYSQPESAKIDLYEG